jgi:hypothetical protein
MNATGLRMSKPKTEGNDSPVALSSAPLRMGIVPLTIMLAAAGFVIAVGMLVYAFVGRDTGPARTFAVAETIDTSFGVVAVQVAEVTNGLTAKDLGGMTHGIQNFVPPDKAQVQLLVTWTNLQNHTIRYDPMQFRLVAGKDRVFIAPQGSSIRPGILEPKASINATLSYVAPRDGSNLLVEFDDPARSTPIVVDIGATEQTPTDESDDIHRHGEVGADK